MGCIDYIYIYIHIYSIYTYQRDGGNNKDPPKAGRRKNAAESIHEAQSKRGSGRSGQGSLWPPAKHAEAGRVENQAETRKREIGKDSKNFYSRLVALARAAFGHPPGRIRQELEETWETEYIGRVAKM